MSTFNCHVLKYRSSLIVCLFIFSLSQSVAQEIESINKKYFVDQQQKLHWQGDLPIYLHISNRPDGKGAVRLKSERTPEYADPMYLDIEGLNFIRARKAVDKETRQVVEPEIELKYEIYKDSETPQTQAYFEDAPRYKVDKKKYFGKGLKVRLASSDAGAGVDRILFSSNGIDYSTYSEVFGPVINQEYSISYYAFDNVGNAEEKKTESFIYDTESPTTALATDGDRYETALSSRSKILLTSTDMSSGVKAIYYQIDSAAETRYDTNIDMKNISNGNHELRYYTVDNVLNKEEINSYSFYLDRLAPEVNATVIGDQYQNRGRVFVSTRSKVKLQAKDNFSGVKRIIYSIDGGPEKIYYEPFKLPKGKGNREIYYHAVDNVNNNASGVLDEKSFDRSSLDLDMDAPELAFTYDGLRYFSRDTTFITKDTKISLAATDDDSGVEEIGYKVNGGKGEKYGGDALSFEAEGIYKIDYYGKDAVNNRNTDDFLVVVDNTGPEIKEVISMLPVGNITLVDEPGPIPVYAKGAKLYLAATDAMIDTKEITLRINDGEQQVYAKPYKFRTPGMVSYQVTASDNLGNVTVTEKRVLFIK